MKILVTGGNGFLGNYIIRDLIAKGHEVSSLARSSQEELRDAGVQVFTGSIEDYNTVRSAVEGKDAVFHVAAKAGIWGEWNSFYNPNVIGTENVLLACKEKGVKYLVYTSTPSVVFSKAEFKGQNEDLSYGYSSLSHYAHTKAIAEKRVLDFNNENLKTIAIRPHLIWGKGDRHIIPRLLNRYKAGRLKIVGNGLNKVDITHVCNAAHAHILALEAIMNGIGCGKPYFVSDGEPVYLWSWINDLIKSRGYSGIKKKVPYRVAYLMGGLMEFVYMSLKLKNEPIMTRFLACQLAKDHYFDITAIQRDLKYKPKMSSQKGLEELSKWLDGQ